MKQSNAGCLLNGILGGGFLMSAPFVVLALKITVEYLGAIDGLDAIILFFFYSLGFLIMGAALHNVIQDGKL